MKISLKDDRSPPEDLNGFTTTSAFWDPRRVNATRSFLLCAFGSALGLAIAGYGLFTANGTVSNAVPPENIALVNQRPILRTDFIAQTEQVTGKPFADASLADKITVLDSMVREELFVQRGLELDFPGTDPDTRTALVSAVEQQAVASITSSQPSEDELRKFYTVKQTSYASDGIMELHHFFFSKGADAEDRARKARDSLLTGSTPAQIVQQTNAQEVIDEHAEAEQFYFAEKSHLGDRLFALAKDLNSGDISSPYVSQDGIHIVQMIKNVRPVPLPFEKARAQVLSDYVQAERKRLTEATESYLREKADIRIAEDYANFYKSREKDAQ